MNGLATLIHINNEADMAGQLRRRPLKRLRLAEDARSAPDYSAVDIKLLEHTSGYKLVEKYFVDSSGWGSSSELALTYPEFIDQLGELIEKKKSEGKKLYACLTGVGLCQVYVGVFEE